MITQEQINTILRQVKEGMEKKLLVVEGDTVNDFLNNFGQFLAIADMVNIKLFDELGEVSITDSLIIRLKMHGHLIFTIQLPDGDRYEIVARYNEAQQKIYNFAYKL